MPVAQKQGKVGDYWLACKSVNIGSQAMHFVKPHSVRLFTSRLHYVFNQLHIYAFFFVCLQSAHLLLKVAQSDSLKAAVSQDQLNE